MARLRACIQGQQENELPPVHLFQWIIHLTLCIALYQANRSSRWGSSHEANYNHTARVIPQAGRTKPLQEFTGINTPSLTASLAGLLKDQVSTGRMRLGGLTILQINNFLLTTICGVAIIRQSLCRQQRIQPQSLSSWSLESKCTFQSKA